MSELIGTRYQPGECIGQGGMAVVYAASDTVLGRTVALKVLRPDLLNDPATVARFEQEARSAAPFNHPHIARIYDVGVDTRYGPFLIQELIEGQNLDTLLPVPATQALEWVAQICSALEAIHAQGLVHCDIKPQNVRITPAGKAILLDFGIAQPEGVIIDPHVLLGTPQYLAPERSQGQPPTAAADVYALGVLLFEALTGRVPLDGNTPVEIIQRHLHEGVPALRSALPGQAASLEALLTRATAREPAQRYASVSALLRDLRAIQQQASTTTQAIPVGPTRNTISIHNQATAVMPRAAAPQARKAPPAAAPLAQPAPPTPINSAPARARSNARYGWTIGGIVAVALAVFFALQSASDTNAETPPQPTVAATTPQLVGTALDTAQVQAASFGLELRIIEQPNAEAASGTVLEQQPPAGAPLPPDHIIAVTVSSGPAAEPPPPAEPAPPAATEPDKGKGKGKGKKDK